MNLIKKSSSAKNWMQRIGIATSLTLGFSLFSTACEQSDPPNKPTVIRDSGDIIFSGYGWKIKESSWPVGPGPNVFNKDSLVWVDSKGYLHLRIDFINGRWQTSEVVCTENTGYGTYIFTVGSDVATLNERVVVGLFTWDNNSFFSAANSEVDIEFSKWFNANDSLTLTYSVQPVIFDNPIAYSERSHKPKMAVSALKGVTTHAFTWRPELISWKSFLGDTYPGNQQIASWQFDNTNQPRVKTEGGISSDPIVIPEPGVTTNPRINLWLLGGQGPSDGKPVELIIRSFKYIPQ